MQRNALFFVGLATVAAIAFAVWQFRSDTAAPLHTTDAPNEVTDTNDVRPQAIEQETQQTTEPTVPHDGTHPDYPQATAPTKRP